MCTLKSLVLWGHPLIFCFFFWGGACRDTHLCQAKPPGIYSTGGMAPGAQWIFFYSRLWQLCLFFTNAQQILAARRPRDVSHKPTPSGGPSWFCGAAQKVRQIEAMQNAICQPGGRRGTQQSTHRLRKRQSVIRQPWGCQTSPQCAQAS